MSDNKTILEKYLKNGIESLSENEVLQLVISFASPKNSEEIAEHLITEFGGMYSVFDADISHLIDVNIINKSTAVLLKVISNMSEKYNNFEKITSLNTEEKIDKYFSRLYNHEEREMIYAVTVDKFMKIKEKRLISTGSVDEVEIDMKKIIDAITRDNVFGIFISHNHLGESAEPSSADYSATRELIKKIRLYEVKVFDHIVVSNSSIFSMKRMNSGIKFDDP